MYNDDTRKRLEDIIRGNVVEGQGDTLAATRNYLCRSFGTNTTVEKNFDYQAQIKKEQGSALIAFINQSNFWANGAYQEEFYLTEGGESKIYFDQSRKNVIKLNDAIYYGTWLDFFNSLLIHNLLFKNTAYELLGFTLKDDGLFAVLKQPFIVADNDIDLNAVQLFLAYNGFKNTRRNDYYSKELGLILEDIHDENVIVNSNVLFFIDTVFYIHITDVNP